MEKELEELALATAALKDAEVLERQARNAATTARNRLNAAQKAIDNALNRMKAAAPRDSEWSEQVMTPSRRLEMRAPIIGATEG